MQVDFGEEGYWQKKKLLQKQKSKNLMAELLFHIHFLESQASSEIIP